MVTSINLTLSTSDCLLFEQTAAFLAEACRSNDQVSVKQLFTKTTSPLSQIILQTSLQNHDLFKFSFYDDIPATWKIKLEEESIAGSTKATHYAVLNPSSLRLADAQVTEFRQIKWRVPLVEHISPIGTPPIHTHDMTLHTTIHPVQSLHMISANDMSPCQVDACSPAIFDVCFQSHRSHDTTIFSTFRPQYHTLMALAPNDVHQLPLAPLSEAERTRLLRQLHSIPLPRGRENTPFASRQPGASRGPSRPPDLDPPGPPGGDRPDGDDPPPGDDQPPRGGAQIRRPSVQFQPNVVDPPVTSSTPTDINPRQSTPVIAPPSTITASGPSVPFPNGMPPVTSHPTALGGNVISNNNGVTVRSEGNQGVDQGGGLNPPIVSTPIVSSDQQNQNVSDNISLGNNDNSNNSCSQNINGININQLVSDIMNHYNNSRQNQNWRPPVPQGQPGPGYGQPGYGQQQPGAGQRFQAPGHPQQGLQGSQGFQQQHAAGNQQQQFAGPRPGGPPAPPQGFYPPPGSNPPVPFMPQPGQGGFQRPPSLMDNPILPPFQNQVNNNIPYPDHNAYADVNARMAALHQSSSMHDLQSEDSLESNAGSGQGKKSRRGGKKIAIAKAKAALRNQSQSQNGSYIAPPVQDQRQVQSFPQQGAGNGGQNLSQYGAASLPPGLQNNHNGNGPHVQANNVASPPNNNGVNSVASQVSGCDLPESVVNGIVRMIDPTYAQLKDMLQGSVPSHLLPMAIERHQDLKLLQKLIEELYQLWGQGRLTVEIVQNMARTHNDCLLRVRSAIGQYAFGPRFNDYATTIALQAQGAIDKLHAALRQNQEARTFDWSLNSSDTRPLVNLGNVSTSPMTQSRHNFSLQGGPSLQASAAASPPGSNPVNISQGGGFDLSALSTQNSGQGAGHSQGQVAQSTNPGTGQAPSSNPNGIVGNGAAATTAPNNLGVFNQSGVAISEAALGRSQFTNSLALIELNKMMSLERVRQLLAEREIELAKPQSLTLRSFQEAYKEALKNREAFLIEEEAKQRLQREYQLQQQQQEEAARQQQLQKQQEEAQRQLQLQNQQEEAQRLYQLQQQQTQSQAAALTDAGAPPPPANSDNLDHVRKAELECSIDSQGDNGSHQPGASFATQRTLTYNLQPPTAASTPANHSQAGVSANGGQGSSTGPLSHSPAQADLSDTSISSQPPGTAPPMTPGAGAGSTSGNFAPSAPEPAPANDGPYLPFDNGSVSVDYHSNSCPNANLNQFHQVSQPASNSRECVSTPAASSSNLHSASYVTTPGHNMSSIRQQIRGQNISNISLNATNSPSPPSTSGASSSASSGMRAGLNALNCFM